MPVVLTLHDYKLVCPTYQLLDKGEVCTACVGGKFWNAPIKRCRDGSLLASSTMALDLSVHTVLRSYRHVDAFVCPSRFLARQMERGTRLPGPACTSSATSSTSPALAGRRTDRVATR